VFPFFHRDLDGHYNSLIGRGSILQLIDPNDGKSSDPDDKQRWQITAVDSMLFGRYLPPKSVGDVWRDEPCIRQWESIDTLPTWSLITDWWQSQYEHWDPLAAQYADRLTCGLPLDRVTRLHLSTDLNTITTDVYDWPQCVPCPHCGDWIQWHEDGYAPGHRSCRNGCKRRWQITMSSGAGHWTMNRIKGK
jgi:hypothetical protein